MTRRRLKVCADPHCPELTRDSYCPAHRSPYEQTRPDATARGYDHRWRDTRARYLLAHPICEHPHGCIRPATDVHHLDGLGPTGPKGHDWENLQALCHSHHSQETAKGH